MVFGHKPGKPREFLNATGLYEYAVGALGRHMRSEAELRRLMQKRVEPGENGEAIMDAVVIRLKDYGFLNDQSFAETYARLRQQNEKHGARRVKQDLQQKGVHEALITETIEARYADTNEETLAREFLEKKRMKKPENPKETARIMRRLVGAGFTTGAIYKILRQWDVPDEALAALENLEEERGEE